MAWCCQFGAVQGEETAALSSQRPTHRNMVSHNTAGPSDGKKFREDTVFLKRIVFLILECDENFPSGLPGRTVMMGTGEWRVPGEPSEEVARTDRCNLILNSGNFS